MCVLIKEGRPEEEPTQISTKSAQVMLDTIGSTFAMHDIGTMPEKDLLFDAIQMRVLLNKLITYSIQFLAAFDF